MNEPPPLSATEREDLIAYLDGELDEDKTRAMEAKLSLDPRGTCSIICRGRSRRRASRTGRSNGSRSKP